MQNNSLLRKNLIVPLLIVTFTFWSTYISINYGYGKELNPISFIHLGLIGYPIEVIDIAIAVFCWEYLSNIFKKEFLKYIPIILLIPDFINDLVNTILTLVEVI